MHRQLHCCELSTFLVFLLFWALWIDAIQISFLNPKELNHFGSAESVTTKLYALVSLNSIWAQKVSFQRVSALLTRKTKLQRSTSSKTRQLFSVFQKTR